jgi:DNA-binding IclR family transcriptional regulator
LYIGGARRALFAIFEAHPPGAEIELLCRHLGLPLAEVEALIDQGMANGELERWPFWPARVRSTGRNAPPFLRDLAELRRAAMPELKRIAEVSGWPATLHLLVDGAHAVVERFPADGDPEEIAREQSRYASPRSLRSGATALAIVAAMPEPARSALIEAYGLEDRGGLLDTVREQGYCLSQGAEVKGAQILSAPLFARDGIPYGALCTYGFADRLPESFEEEAAAAIVRGSVQVSQSVSLPVVARRARALVEGMVREATPT